MRDLVGLLINRGKMKLSELQEAAKIENKSPEEIDKIIEQMIQDLEM